jgi:hypothetical protein
MNTEKPQGFGHHESFFAADPMEEKKKRRRRRRKLWQMSRKEEEVKAEAVVVNDPIADIEAEDITAPEAESEDIQSTMLY